MEQVKDTPAQPKKQALWENSYSNTKFTFELIFMSLTLIFWGKLVAYTLQFPTHPLFVVSGFIIAQFLVDFVSGMLHWACDTWGEFTTPFVGPTLIRSFRMHHVDPQDITKHGFVETNASTSFAMPPFILIGMLLTPSNWILQTYNWTIIFGVILGILTNEFHKWAHMVHSKPNRVIRFLQGARLIISHDHHHRHHTGQFDQAYCIINGWMNPILEKIDYWRKLERFIQNYTGLKPRADDNFWRAIKRQ